MKIKATIVLLASSHMSASIETPAAAQKKPDNLLKLSGKVTETFLFSL